MDDIKIDDEYEYQNAQRDVNVHDANGVYDARDGYDPLHLRKNGHDRGDGCHGCDRVYV